jgi:fumarate hydratase class II
MEYRIEKDTMGEVKVPADKYWGAQTERSRNNFRIGPPGSMPREIVHAFAYLKKAAALTNLELGKLPQGEERPDRQGVRRDPGRQARRSVPAGDLADRQRHAEQHERERGGGLPRARAQGGKLTDEEKVLNPNDDVNKSQSSNDTFPTAMHIAAYKLTVEVTIPGREEAA